MNTATDMTSDDISEFDEDFDLEEDEIESVEEKVDRADTPKHVKNSGKIQVTRPDERLTSSVLTLYEMTEAISVRTIQIERGAYVFTDVSGYTDPIQMAKKEFIDRKNPFILERIVQRIPGFNNHVEHWKVREMGFPITDKQILDLTDKEIERVLPQKLNIVRKKAKTSVQKKPPKSTKQK